MTKIITTTRTLTVLEDVDYIFGLMMTNDFVLLTEIEIWIGSMTGETYESIIPTNINKNFIVEIKSIKEEQK